MGKYREYLIKDMKKKFGYITNDKIKILIFKVFKLLNFKKIINKILKLLFYSIKLF